MFRHFLKEDLDAVRSFLKQEDPVWEGTIDFIYLNKNLAF